MHSTVNPLYMFSMCCLLPRSAVIVHAIGSSTVSACRPTCIGSWVGWLVAPQRKLYSGWPGRFLQQLMASAKHADFDHLRWLWSLCSGVCSIANSTTFGLLDGTVHYTPVSLNCCQCTFRAVCMMRWRWK